MGLPVLLPLLALATLGGWVRNGTSDPGNLLTSWQSSNSILSDEDSSNSLSFLWLALPALISPMERAWKQGQESNRAAAMCQACKFGVGLAMDYVRAGNSPERLLQMTDSSCRLLNVLDKDMCSGVVREFGPTLMYIVKESKNLTAAQLCSGILQSTGCVAGGDNESLPRWDILPRGGFKSFIKETVRSEEPSTGGGPGGVVNNIKGTMKILHITDVHMDPHYRPGALAGCKKEVCCRGEQVSGKGRAGFYGDYRYCDLPYHTFELAIKHMAKTHKDITLVYLTGDLIPHTGIGWKTDIDEVKSIFKNVSLTIKNYFPKAVVLPVIGNHDTHPMNQFATASNVPQELSTEWVYQMAVDTWTWITGVKAKRSLGQFGYYRRNFNKGRFRVLVMNNNMCFTSNFWQYKDWRDPGGQLEWLVKQLEEAEKAQAKVHILGHIPPNFEGCSHEWSRNFYEIVTRFSKTIRAQFYGHTHHDDFGLYYHPLEKNRPIGSFWVGASLTPYFELNPGYKIYTVEGQIISDGKNNNSEPERMSYDVLDHETWICNLTEANSKPQVPPRWFKLYSAKEAYGLQDLSLGSLHEFTMRMTRNLTEFEGFYRHFHKAADVETRKICNEDCRKRTLCNVVSPYYKKYSECMLLNTLKGHHLDTEERELLPSQFFQPVDLETWEREQDAESSKTQSWYGKRVMGAKTKSYMMRKGRF